MKYSVPKHIFLLKRGSNIQEVDLPKASLNDGCPNAGHVARIKPFAQPLDITSERVLWPMTNVIPIGVHGQTKKTSLIAGKRARTKFMHVLPHAPSSRELVLQ